MAGAAGIQREVAWCAVLRVRAPAFEPLRGGELVLVDPAVLAVVDARLTLPRLIDSLASAGIAALAHRGPVSTVARRAADAHGMVVFEMPAGGPELDDLEQRVLRYIVDRRAELHERTQDLHRQLSELALAGRGLRAVLDRLTELVGVPVVFEHGSSIDYVAAGRVRTLPPEVAAAIADQRASLEAWLKEVPLSAFDPPVVDRPLPGGRSRLCAPILVQGSIAGFVSLIGQDGQLGEVHRLAVGRASHACAIELVRERAAREAKDELEEEVLDVLTGGRPGSQAHAMERLRRQGVSLERPYLLVAGQPDDSRRAAELRAAWERALNALHLKALVRERETSVLAIIAMDSRARLDAVSLTRELQRAGQAADRPVGIGFARVRTGPSEVAAAAREAEQALAMGRRLQGASHLTGFEDLGLYRLLYALQQEPELRQFAEESLAGLRVRDRGGDLRQTLRAYLDVGGSPTDAALRLNLHRNTVLYRLRRIEELLGVDLREPETRLRLHLAMRIEDVVEP
ncbi:MAG TPA: helix-turn-helix domain-containing protein [Candidatus Limnocylindrales bacterium]|nr:helix-turn-helix domain-containing protein [Candidatus Limnocylindrales bacterium]